MNRIVLTLTFCLAALFAHGQSYDSMRRATNAVGTDLIALQTNSAGLAGQKFTAAMTLDNFLRTLAGLDEWDDFAGGSGGVSNGDKGDITVSGGGGTWRVNTHVTNGINTRVTALEAAATVSSNGLQAQVTAVTNGLNEGNVLYVRTNGNNSTALRGRPDRPFQTIQAAIAVAVPGDTVFAGGGEFTHSDTWDWPHRVNFRGAGKGITTLRNTTQDLAAYVPGSDSYHAGFTLINRGSGNTFHLPLGSLTPDQKFFTNAVVEDVEIYGDTDAVYIADSSGAGETTSLTIRRAEIRSSFDSIYAGGSTNFFIKIENSTIYADAIGETNTANTSRMSRAFLTPFGGRIEASDVHVVSTNLLRAQLIHADEAGTNFIVLRNVTHDLVVTNGGLVQAYKLDRGGTNSFIKYIDVPAEMVVTNGTAYTATHGPQVIRLTSGSARTVTLPNIGSAGKSRYSGITIEVVDASGNAGLTFPIVILPSGGATIDGAPGDTNTTAYSSTIYAVNGTNWTAIKQRASRIAGPFEITGDARVEGLITLPSYTPDTLAGFDSGLEPGLTSVGIGSGLSLAGNVLSATGGGGGSGTMTTLRTNAAVAGTNLTALLFTNANVASPIEFQVGSNAAVATISATIKNMSGSGNAVGSNAPTMYGATLLGSTVGGTANFTDGSIGTFSTTDLLVEGPATVEGPLRAESSIWTPGNITNSVLYPSNGVALLEKPLTQSGTNLVADGSLSGSFSNNITANVGGVTNVLFINMVDGVTYDLWLSISPGVTVQLPQFASGTNWTGGRVPTFATNTVPVLIKATRRGVITNAVISQTDLVLENGPGVIAVTNFVTGKVTYMLDPVLTNLMGTVARNVTNENSTALEIDSGTLSITPGALSNLVNNTSINFQPGNSISNLGGLLYLVHTPAITTSNLLLNTATNRHHVIGCTNAIFTNLVELATGQSADLTVYVQNTTGVSMGLVWPAFGAQHGYYFSTNVYNDVRSKTSLASGARGMASFSFFGTNIVPTWTDW